MSDDIDARKHALERPTVTPLRCVLIPLAAQYTGYSQHAIRNKIDRGDWPEGKLWRRAPDGRIFIDLPGVQRWVGTR